MTSNSNAAPGLFPGKIVVFLLAVGLMVIFVSSVFYRLQNPSRTVVRQEAPAGGKSMKALAKMGNMGQIRDLMQALQKNPEDLPTLMSLASVFMEMGAWDRAALFLQDALNVEPTNKDALNFYGICLYQKKDYAKSAEVFSQLLELDPDNPMAHYNLGVMQKYFLDKPDEGMENFRRAKALAPQDPRLTKLVNEELEATHGSAK